MNHDQFITAARQAVAEYTNEHMDATDNFHITPEDVYVVWSVKALQNSKALLSTNVTDGMYYELTLNGDKGEIYFDAYKKFQNKTLKCGDLL